jgi:hypothetical protein
LCQKNKATDLQQVWIDEYEVSFAIDSYPFNFFGVLKIKY